MKHQKGRRMQFEPNDQYLVDKVKLLVNAKAEVVLISTSLTVLRVESEESYSVESMELSQKQREVRDDVGGFHASVSGFMGSPQIKKYTGLNKPSLVSGNEYARMQQANRAAVMEI